MLLGLLLIPILQYLRLVRKPLYQGKNLFLERKCTTIYAHRGNSDGKYPENSIESFHEALKQGADIIETDLRLSKDGVVMVFHDKYLINLGYQHEVE